MIDFTVAICTYNGAQRIPTVLDKLLSQVETEGFIWEIIVVDNNSSDDTANVVRDYQSKYSQVRPIKYYFESHQGTAFARRLAIHKAESELVGFLDDDNYPDLNWVSAAYKFGQEHPKAGGYGSKVRGQYDQEPPPNFEKIACFLAIVDQGSKPFRYDLLKQWVFPPGAGMVIRRKAWLESVSEKPLLSGPLGKELANKGEDIESFSYLRKAGWEIWYNPEMQITHHIPSSRLQPMYLLKLFRGVGLSRYITRTIYRPKWQHLLITPVYFLSDLYKLITHYCKYYASLNEDIIVRCKLELLIWSTISPFYYLRKYLSINSQKAA